MAVNTWARVYDPYSELVVEWLLHNPYTGPGRAHDATGEWVHYPNGALKIRYKPMSPELRAVLSERPRENPFKGLSPDEHYARRDEIQAHMDQMRRDTQMMREYVDSPGLCGVRYVVPAELFQDPDELRHWVSVRVNDFIENLDEYRMVDGKYHQGE